SISWGDGSSSTGEPFDNGDGTFSVWASHTYASAASLTAAVQVTHTASGFYGSASVSATITAPTPPPAPTAPAQPTGLTVNAISPTEMGLVWDHIPDATSYTITRTSDDWGTQTIPVADPSANSY